MDGTCRAYGVSRKFMQNSSRKASGRDLLGNVGVQQRLICKWILKMKGVELIINSEAKACTTEDFD